MGVAVQWETTRMFFITQGNLPPENRFDNHEKVLTPLPSWGNPDAFDASLIDGLLNDASTLRFFDNLRKSALCLKRSSFRESHHKPSRRIRPGHDPRPAQPIEDRLHGSQDLKPRHPPCHCGASRWRYLRRGTPVQARLISAPVRGASLLYRPVRRLP